jgi:hypothetical protein
LRVPDVEVVGLAVPEWGVAVRALGSVGQVLGLLVVP